MTGLTKRSAVGEQALPLLRVLKEGVHGARHQIARGLVAGNGQKEEEQLELHFTQLLALHLDRGQDAHEVGVGVDALPGEQLGRVGVELHGGVERHFSFELVLGVLVAHHAV